MAPYFYSSTGRHMCGRILCVCALWLEAFSWQSRCRGAWQDVDWVNDHGLGIFVLCDHVTIHPPCRVLPASLCSVSFKGASPFIACLLLLSFSMKLFPSGLPLGDCPSSAGGSMA